jgi:hypothetical protein
VAETVIDYERVLVALKAYLMSKPSHGQRDLLAAISRMEVESVRQEESERVARLADSAGTNGRDRKATAAASDRARELGAMPSGASTR